MNDTDKEILAKLVKNPNWAWRVGLTVKCPLRFERVGVVTSVLYGEITVGAPGDPNYVADLTFRTRTYGTEKGTVTDYPVNTAHLEVLPQAAFVGTVLQYLYDAVLAGDPERSSVTIERASENRERVVIDQGGRVYTYTADTLAIALATALLAVWSGEESSSSELILEGESL